MCKLFRYIIKIVATSRNFHFHNDSSVEIEWFLFGFAYHLKNKTPECSVLSNFNLLPRDNVKVDSSNQELNHFSFDSIQLFQRNIKKCYRHCMLFGIIPEISSRVHKEKKYGVEHFLDSKTLAILKKFQSWFEHGVHITQKSKREKNE